jgi:hypothetical protein
MKLKYVVFPLILLIFVSILSTACGSAPEEAAVPPEEVLPTKSEKLKEFEAMEPTFVIQFDGEECLVEGPSEVKFGEYLFVLHNHTDLPASQALGSYFGEGSYENHFQWREENCGGQGTYCEDEEGIYQSYSLATWYNPINQTHDGDKAYYKIFKVDTEREYVIWAYSDLHWGWLCAPFQVTK